MSAPAEVERDFANDPRDVRECLVWLMREVQEIHKGRTAPDQIGGYAFRGIDQVLNAVGPKLREVGLVVLPNVVNVDSEVSNAIVQGVSKKPVRFVTVTAEFTLVAPDGSKETVRIVGEAGDTGDKSISKATSVALRIMWITLLQIPTGEKDPDEQGYERTAPAAQADDPTEAKKLRDRIERAANKGTLQTAYAAVKKAYTEDGAITEATFVALNELTKQRLAQLEPASNGAAQPAQDGAQGQ